MEPSKALIEAGARALVSSLCVYIDMDAPNMQNRANYYRRIAADVLRSAMGGVEVVYTHKVDHECEASLISDDQPIDERDILFRKGDTLAVFRGGE